MGGDLQGQEGKMAVLTHLENRSHNMWKLCIQYHYRSLRKRLYPSQVNGYISTAKMGGRGWRIHLVPIPLFKSFRMLTKTFQNDPPIDSESFMSFK